MIYKCRIPYVALPSYLVKDNPSRRGIQRVTYRRLEVGADATDARADSPGSDGPSELGKLPPLLLLPGLRLDLSREPKSGIGPDVCDDADDAPTVASVCDGRSVEELSMGVEVWL